MNDELKDDYQDVAPMIVKDKKHTFVTEFELFGDIKIQPEEFCKLYDKM